MNKPDDSQHFDHAIKLACDNMGQTWPNPAVGCVIVAADGHTVLAAQATQKGGRPHAEYHALQSLGFNAVGATAYITLEPCAHAHIDKPLSCTDALIQSGIKRVVYGAADPNHLVNGMGLEKLRAAGVVVARANEQQIEMCQTIIAGHVTRLRHKRPYVTLKMAVSTNDVIGIRGVAKAQITGQAAQRYTHTLRGMHDAIVVGGQTVLSDDPLLSNRFGHRQPRRIIVTRDQKFEIPKNAAMLQNSGVSPQIIVAERITDVLQQLYDQGFSRILVESGGQLAQAFFKENVVDEVIVLRSNQTIIGDVIAAASIPTEKFKLNETFNLGDDICTKYKIIPDVPCGCVLS